MSPDGGAVIYVHGEANDYGTAQTVLQVLDIERGQMSSPVDTEHGRLAAVSWHPDSRSFVTAGPDGFVRTWDARQVRIVTARRSFAEAIGVAHLGSGGQIALIGPGGPVERLDTDSLAQVGAPFLMAESESVMPSGEGETDAIGGHRFDFDTAAWYASSDGRTAALLNVVDERQDDAVTTSDVRVIKDELILVDVIDGRMRSRVDLGIDAHRAAFSPDGARIAVAGLRGQVAIVDVATGTLVRPPVFGHDGTVASISYAPNGETIATGGQDGRVSLWNGRTGTLLSSTTVGRPGRAAFVGFKPDGQTVSVATWDGEVYELDTRLESWIAFACDVAGRNLTRAEWGDTFGNRPYRETC